MEAKAADNPVPLEIKALFSGQRVVLGETSRAVTPLGGVAVFVAFLEKLNFAGKVGKHMAFRCTSPNQIEPAVTLTAFLIAVLAAAKRFAHAGMVRGDRALHALLGIKRFPTDDTIGNLFRRFKMGDLHRLFDPLAEWMMERLPVGAEGYTLDLDSTVFERYGQQEGSLKGHNPRKHGRPSHHPLLAVLSEAHFLLHGWLRSGNCASAPPPHGRRPVRGDPGAESWSFSKKLWRYGLSAKRSALSVPILASSTTSCSAFWKSAVCPTL